MSSGGANLPRGAESKFERCDWVRLDTGVESSGFVRLLEHGPGRGGAQRSSFLRESFRRNDIEAAQQRHSSHSPGGGLEDALSHRFEEGRIAGISEAEAVLVKKNMEQYEQVTRNVECITSEIAREVENRIAVMERTALRLSIAIAKKLIGENVKANPEYILELIRRGLQSLGAAKPLRIRVSPADYAFLSGTNDEAITDAANGLRYLEDKSITSGCVVETEYGEVNLDVDEMWKGLEEQLNRLVE